MNILQHCQRINPSFPRCTESLKGPFFSYGGILRSDFVAVLAEGGTVQGAARLFVVPVLFVPFSMIECRKDGWEELEHMALAEC